MLKPTTFLGSMISGAIALAIGVPSASAAPPTTKRGEVRVDTREIRTDRRERRDDRLDLARLKTLHAAYKKARLEANLKAIDRLDQRFLTELRKEKRESAGEIRRDAAELRRSKAEVRKDRRDLRRPTANQRAAARSLAKDRRDVRDDRRDLRVEVGTRGKHRRISKQFAALVGRNDVRSLKQKQDLIHEVMRMARAELRRDRRELREDKRERREDRRDARRRHERRRR